MKKRVREKILYVYVENENTFLDFELYYFCLIKNNYPLLFVQWAAVRT